jgi:hypothetical protein
MVPQETPTVCDVFYCENLGNNQIGVIILCGRCWLLLANGIMNESTIEQLREIEQKRSADAS